MPGDPLKKVHPGEPLVIPAAAYNAFVEAAQAERQRQRGGRGKLSRYGSQSKHYHHSQ